VRALGAGINPRLDELTQPLLRSRSGIAPKSWIPSPGDEVIRREVLMEQRQVASAIAAGILELCADFTHRLSLPCHFDGSEAPAGMTLASESSPGVNSKPLCCSSSLSSKPLIRFGSRLIATSPSAIGTQTRQQRAQTAAQECVRRTKGSIWQNEPNFNLSLYDYMPSRIRAAQRSRSARQRLDNARRS
jgi:hypothetical protein